jgi:hypothetical protein
VLAHTPAGWRDALEQLRDPAERARVRQLGLDRARELDINTRWRDWETVYERLLSRADTRTGS